MKTRNGFVSNSSSTSFFLPLKKWPNTYEVAWYMIERRMEYFKEMAEDFEDEADGHYKERYASEKTRGKQLLKNLTNITDKDENLFFLSVNEDTHITKVNVKDLQKGTCWLRIDKDFGI